MKLLRQRVGDFDIAKMAHHQNLPLFATAKLIDNKIFVLYIYVIMIDFAYPRGDFITNRPPKMIKIEINLGLIYGFFCIPLQQIAIIVAKILRNFVKFCQIFALFGRKRVINRCNKNHNDI